MADKVLDRKKNPRKYAQTEKLYEEYCKEQEKNISGPGAALLGLIRDTVKRLDGVIGELNDLRNAVGMSEIFSGLHKFPPKSSAPPVSVCYITMPCAHSAAARGQVPAESRTALNDTTRGGAVGVSPSSSVSSGIASPLPTKSANLQLHRHQNKSSPHPDVERR